jgi:hypothetical protein
MRHLTIPMALQSQLHLQDLLRQQDSNSHFHLRQRLHNDLHMAMQPRKSRCQQARRSSMLSREVLPNRGIERHSMQQEQMPRDHSLA